MFKFSRWHVLGLILLLGLAMFVLVYDNSDDSDKKDDKQDSSTVDTSDNPTIILAYNPWTASELNVNVAKILLEEKAGYSVTLVAINESDQWDVLVAGDIHASLEVWGSGHVDNYQKYVVTDQTVEDGGELGPVGKIGWYVPTYILRDYSELATWEGFLDNETVSLFSTEATDDKGQFLAGDPGWTHHDAAIISNLGLNLEVVELEGENLETAVIEQVKTAYDNTDPILFYFWTPHSLHAQYDLEQVELPPYTEECYAVEADIACDYPEDRFYKIFWAGLSDYAPSAYQFLQNMNYSNRDQITMLAAVEIEGKPVAEAAQDWIDDNEAVWQTWIPE